MRYTIREIEQKDNAAVEALIRFCLKEFGGDREGTAWCDPDLGRFSEIYGTPLARYWVAVGEDGKVLAGAGYGPLPGVPGVCELQKMYSFPEARGTGIAHQLIRTVLQEAARHYDRCYLETFSNMTAARKFYGKYGFLPLREAMGSTGHTSCDVQLIRPLTTGEGRA